MLLVRDRPQQQPVLERALAGYWRDHAASLPPLLCDDGSRLRVLYAGRASASAGPDFRDAVLQRESGEVVRGDVELHLRRGGWEAHGHQNDRGYNGVVLHVVLHGGDGPVVLASGKRVPTAALFPRTLGRAPRRETPPARPLPLATLPSRRPRLAHVLDREGDARFFQKARRFAEAMRTSKPGTAAAEPDEVLYRGLMAGLGYGGNSAAMLHLAEGAPLRALSRAVEAVPAAERRNALADALLQASGLTVTEGAPRAVTPVVGRDEWKLFRVRPANHPSRRLQGMATLLDRAWDAGLASWAAALVPMGGVKALQAALTVAADSGGALIGGDRASDLAVNVVLPFLRAWGNVTGDGGLPAAALALYRAWPPLQENAVTTEAVRLLGAGDTDARDLCRSARRQQGLIRVYRRRLGGEPEGRG